MFKLTISRLTVVFGIVVTIGLSYSIGIQWLTLNELKVGGPVFNQIVDGKDLVADILPPPLYLVEAYGMANEATIHEELIPQNLKMIRELRKSYDDRRSYWASSGLPSELKAFLESEVLRTADLFGRTSKGASQRLGTSMTATLCTCRSMRCRASSGPIKPQWANSSK